MAEEKKLIYEDNGTVSFGDHRLAEKKKVSDYEIGGSLYKVKSYREMTKLERNDLLLYESVPGTTVRNLDFDGGRVTFTAEGSADAQIILNLEDGATYRVVLNGAEAGVMKTSMGGKLSFNVELAEGSHTDVLIEKQ